MHRAASRPGQGSICCANHRQEEDNPGIFTVLIGHVVMHTQIHERPDAGDSPPKDRWAGCQHRSTGSRPIQPRALASCRQGPRQRSSTGSPASLWPEQSRRRGPTAREPALRAHACEVRQPALDAGCVLEDARWRACASARAGRMYSFPCTRVLLTRRDSSLAADSLAGWAEFGTHAPAPEAGRRRRGRGISLHKLAVRCREPPLGRVSTGCMVEKTREMTREMTSLDCLPSPQKPTEPSWVCPSDSHPLSRRAAHVGRPGRPGAPKFAPPASERPVPLREHVHAGALLGHVRVLRRGCPVFASCATCWQRSRPAASPLSGSA